MAATKATRAQVIRYSAVSSSRSKAASTNTFGVAVVRGPRSPPDCRLGASVVGSSWRSGMDRSRKLLSLPSPGQHSLELVGLGPPRDHPFERVGPPGQGLHPVQP